MNALFLFYFCVAIAINGCVSKNDVLTDDKDINEAWNEFVKTYNKTYLYEAEKDVRKKIFEQNSDLIKKHNEKYKKEDVTFGMGMNKFGDLTHEEFLKLFSTKEGHCPVKLYEKVAVDVVYNVDFDDDDYDVALISESWNWVEKGAVNKEVEDQGDCKSGWAYSAVGAMEGRYFVKNKTVPLPSFDVEFLIKCTRGHGGNCGCEWGDAANAFSSAKMYGAMPMKNSYAKYGTCKIEEIKDKISLPFKRCQNHSMESPSKVKKDLKDKGPVSGAISAEQPGFQFAKEGVYSEDTCDHKPNHEVLIVGYGNENGHDYWLVKNSFGLSWGDNGYLKISTEKSQHGCHILNSVSYPEF